MFKWFILLLLGVCAFTVIVWAILPLSTKEPKVELLRSVSFGTCTKCKSLIPLWDAKEVDIPQYGTEKVATIKVYACPNDSEYLAPVFVDPGSIIKVSEQIKRPGELEGQ